jgi:serine/threonine protein kinase
VQDKASAEGKTFTVVGTYGYAPIEQFGGRAVPASDLYALGATLIHLLTGISPAELPQDDMRIEFRDRTSCDRKLLHWIESLTEPSLKKRPETARQAIEALKTGRSIVKKTAYRLEKPAKSNILLYRFKDGLIIELPRTNKYFFEWVGISVICLICAAIGFTFCLISFGLLWVWVHSLSTTGGLISLFQEDIAATLFLLFVSVMTWSATAAFTYWFRNKLIAEYGKESLFINEQKLLLEKDLFGFKWKNSKSDYPVTSVHQGLAIDSNNPKSVLYLNTIINRYAFGAGLQSDECMWLEQEIKDFLGLK